MVSQKQNKMVVAIDFDGVIANTGQTKARWIQKHLHYRIPVWKTDRTSCVPLIGLANYEAMGREVYGKKATFATKPVPGVQRALTLLSRHAEIHIITARYAQPVAFAKSWLSRWNLMRFITLFHAAPKSGLSKEQLCMRISAQFLVDDDLRHFKSIRSRKITPIWFRMGPTTKLVGVKPARNWKEVLELILVPSRNL